MFVTRLNVQAGLAGFYLIRDRSEDRMHLPSGQFEVPLAIQDRSFNQDGSFFYPASPDLNNTDLPRPSIVTEFYGDVALVNGKVWPFLEVQARQYRLRILNGANSRFFNLQLQDQANGTAGPSFLQIGTDQGFLNTKPALITGPLLLGPGERADVLVDFAGWAGKSLLLHNSDQTNPPLPDIMQFNVTAISGPVPVSVFPVLPTITPLDPSGARHVTHLLNEVNDAVGRPLPQLNGQPFSDPASLNEMPLLGSREVWTFDNFTPDIHPIHMHLVHFTLVGRVPHTDTILNSFVDSEGDKNGPKDTILVPPGYATSVIARFDRPGEYVYHCHILEHEEYDMMRRFQVIDTKQP